MGKSFRERIDKIRRDDVKRAAFALVFVLAQLLFFQNCMPMRAAYVQPQQFASEGEILATTTTTTTTTTGLGTTTFTGTTTTFVATTTTPTTTTVTTTTVSAGMCVQGDYHRGPLTQPLQIHPTDRKRLVTGGKLFYPLGIYGYSFNMADNDADSASTEDALKIFLLNQQKQQIDLHAANGLNYYRMWLNWGTVEYRDNQARESWDRNVLTPYPRSGGGTAADGKPKLNLSQFNPKYFDLLREVVDYANTKGVVLQMIMLDCWHSGQYGEQFGFYAREFYNGANNSSGVNVTTRSQWFVTSGQVWDLHQNFLKKVIDTVGDRPNIVYETCNENTYSDRSFDRAIAETIDSYEASKGFAKHLIVGPSAANSPKINIFEHMQTPGHKAPATKDSESIFAFRNRLLDSQWQQRPTISDNDCCGGQPSAHFMRKKTWMALTAGAHVQFFNEDFPDAAVRTNANSTSSINYMGHVLNFLYSNKVKLDGMLPAPNDGTVVTRDVAFAIYKPDEYIVYAPNGGTFQVAGLPANLTAIWYDPRTGNSKLAGNGPSFTTPDAQDWVLFIKGYAAGATCPIPYGSTLRSYTPPQLTLNHVRDGLVYRVSESPPYAYIYNVNAPSNKSYRRMEFEIDVRITQWSSNYNGNPDKDWHMIYWLQRGNRWNDGKRGNVMGLLNLIERGSVRANLQTSLDGNIGPDMYNIEASGQFSTGNTYHFKQVYDAEKSEVTVEAWSGSTKVLSMSGPAFGMSIDTYNYSFIQIGLSNSELDDGPEAPSIGWEYSNIKLRLYE